MIKVLLTGTLGAGKTTLAEMLASCPAVAVVREVARDLLEEWPQLQAEPIFQDMVLKEQCRREEEARSLFAPVVVCDRGIPDVQAYCKYFGHPPRVIDQKWTYDIVLVCNAGDVDQSVIEPARLPMRAAIDLGIRNELSSRGSPFTLISGTPLQRCQLVVEEIARSCDDDLVEKQLRVWLDDLLNARGSYN